MAFNAFYVKNLNHKVFEEDYVPVTPCETFCLPAYNDRFFWSNEGGAPILCAADSLGLITVMDNEGSSYLVEGQPFVNGRPPHPAHYE